MDSTESLQVLLLHPLARNVLNGVADLDHVVLLDAHGRLDTEHISGSRATAENNAVRQQAAA